MLAIAGIEKPRRASTIILAFDTKLPASASIWRHDTFDGHYHYVAMLSMTHFRVDEAIGFITTTATKNSAPFRRGMDISRR